MRIIKPDLDAIVVTPEQLVKIQELANKVNTAREVRFSPDENYQTQRIKHKENLAQIKTISTAASDEAFRILSKTQQKRAKQIKLQLDLESGFYDAALEEIDASPNSDEYENIRESLAFAPMAADVEAKRLRRRLVLRALEQVRDKAEVKELVGEPFFFPSQVRPANSTRHRIPKRLLEPTQKKETNSRR